jgi:hypothetical protein
VLISFSQVYSLQEGCQEPPKNIRCDYRELGTMPSDPSPCCFELILQFVKFFFNALFKETQKGLKSLTNP